MHVYRVRIYEFGERTSRVEQKTETKRGGGGGSDGGWRFTR